MANSDNMKVNNQVHRSADEEEVEEGNTEPQQETNLAGSPESKDLSDPQKRENAGEGTLSSPTNSYDPENPMPYFLAQEAKYVNAASASSAKDVPVMEEFRVADVEHTLSCKSILCWSMVTILLVGGSLVAVALTVDFEGTTGGDVDLDNSTAALELQQP